ncbi:MAG: hypothetical protein AAB225_10655 [Acidobacteriota bacterium]
MKTERSRSRLTVAAILAALPAAAQQQAAAGTATLSPVSGYVRVLPRLYKFSGDQGYLQRYRALDAPNKAGIDRFLETANGLGIFVARSGGGPLLELQHVNPFPLNDQWLLRYWAAAGVRFDVQWNDYQRGFDRYLPPTAPSTFTYAKQFNDDSARDDFLRRRRSDFRAVSRWEPSAFKSGPRVLRSVELEFERARRIGYRQFNWMFGIPEDLVVPVGTDPARWRGRTEDLSQTVHRYGIASTLSFAKSNLIRLRFFGEQFDMRPASFTNADVARRDPRVNTQPRTINFIPDNRIFGGEVSIEQKFGSRVTLLVDGLLEELKQASFAPLQTASGYHSTIRSWSTGANLFVDLTEAAWLEAFTRWRQRKNLSQIGQAAAGRPYLMTDRNLSTPFVRERAETILGGSLTHSIKGATLRAGVRHERGKRDFLRGTGENAVPEGLTVYHPRSTPTDLWVSVSGRPKKQLRWAARTEFRTAGETYALNDPERRIRVRGSATLASKSGNTGASVSFGFTDERNDQFALQSRLGKSPQLWDVRDYSTGVQGWFSAGSRVQFQGAFQHLLRDHAANFVATDVRRWRPFVVPSLAEEGFGYEGSAKVLSLGASLAVHDRLTLLPNYSLAIAGGGIVSAKTPLRGYSLIDNDHNSVGIGADCKVSEQVLFHLRYEYSRYNDQATPLLAGRLHGVSFGLSRVF